MVELRFIQSFLTRHSDAASFTFDFFDAAGAKFEGYANHTEIVETQPAKESGEQKW